MPTLASLSHWDEVERLRLSPVGTRTGLSGLYGASNEVGPYLFQESRSRHGLPYGAGDLYACYAGFHVGPTATEFEARPRAFHVAGCSVQQSDAWFRSGDVLELELPSQIRPARLSVVAVTATGQITHLAVLDGGGYSEMAGDTCVVHRPGSRTEQATLSIVWAGCGLAMTLGVDVDWSEAKKSLRAKGDFERRAMTRVPLGGIAASCAFAIRARPGSEIGLRYSGTYGGWGRLSIGHDEFSSGKQAFSEVDDASFGGTPGPSQGFTQPLCLLGTPARPGLSVVILGDGLAAGSTGVGRDRMDALGHIGWAEKALARSAPWSNFSSDGDRYARWFGDEGRRNLRLRAIAALRFDAALVALGLNDFGLGASLDEVLQLEQRLAADLRLAGVRVLIGITITPVTASSDGWATVEQQQRTPISELISQRNRMVRAKHHPVQYDAFIDCAAVCEADEGFWKPQLTPDGYHPNEQGHTLMARNASALLAKVLG